MTAVQQTTFTSLQGSLRSNTTNSQILINQENPSSMPVSLGEDWDEAIGSVSDGGHSKKYAIC